MIIWTQYQWSIHLVVMVCRLSFDGLPSTGFLRRVLRRASFDGLPSTGTGPSFEASFGLRTNGLLWGGGPSTGSGLWGGGILRWASFDGLPSTGADPSTGSGRTGADGLPSTGSGRTGPILRRAQDERFAVGRWCHGRVFDGLPSTGSGRTTGFLRRAQDRGPVLRRARRTGPILRSFDGLRTNGLLWGGGSGSR